MTLVAAGATVPICLEAADRLGSDVADVIDLSTLYPWTRPRFSSRSTRRVGLSSSTTAGIVRVGVARLQPTSSKQCLISCCLRRYGSRRRTSLSRSAAGAEDRYVLHAEEVVRRVASLLSEERATAAWWEPYTTAMASGPDVHRSIYTPG